MKYFFVILIYKIFFCHIVIYTEDSIIFIIPNLMVISYWYLSHKLFKFPTFVAVNLKNNATRR